MTFWEMEKKANMERGQSRSTWTSAERDDWDSDDSSDVELSCQMLGDADYDHGWFKKLRLLKKDQYKEAVNNQEAAS